MPSTSSCYVVLWKVGRLFLSLDINNPRGHALPSCPTRWLINGLKYVDFVPDFPFLAANSVASRFVLIILIPVHPALLCDSCKTFFFISRLSYLNSFPVRQNDSPFEVETMRGYFVEYKLLCLLPAQGAARRVKEPAAVALAPEAVNEKNACLICPKNIVAE